MVLSNFFAFFEVNENDTLYQSFQISDNVQINNLIEEYSNSSKFRVCNVDEINNEEIGLDIGPETAMIFKMIMESSKSMLPFL